MFSEVPIETDELSSCGSQWFGIRYKNTGVKMQSHENEMIQVAVKKLLQNPSLLCILRVGRFALSCVEEETLRCAFFKAASHE